MKKVFLFLLLLISINAFSQKIKQEITKVNGKYKIEHNGNFFDVDLSTITVKLKKGKELGLKYKFYRKNKLGYIDLVVPKNSKLEDFISLLLANEDVIEIEYNSIGHYIGFVPNDTDLSNQWYLPKIKFYNANGITTGNSNVVVGVLDSGTDWLHSDLGLGNNTYQNIYLNSGEDAWNDPDDPSTGNGIDDDNNGLIDDWKGWNYANNTNNVITNNYHGTLVAGIISAKTNNSDGIAGVAGGKNSEGVKVMPYCVGINQPLGAVLDDAIIDAVDEGVKVIQLSLSVTPSAAIDNAIQYAINNNVIIICASGNGSSVNIPYPASHNNVMAVGATDQNDSRANFSNYGNNLNLVAPGVGIYGLSLNNQYTTQDGTSFAAPQVSATAALMFSINSTLTPQEIRNFIETSADKVTPYNYSTVAGHPNGTWNNEVGYGRLNLENALISVISDTGIEGPNEICIGQQVTYSLVDLALPGATITWTYPTNKMYVVSGQGTANCTFGAFTGGNGNLIKATVSYNGNQDVYQRNNIKISSSGSNPSTPTIAIAPNNPANLICCGQTQTFNHTVCISNCTNIEWSFNVLSQNPQDLYAFATTGNTGYIVAKKYTYSPLIVGAKARNIPVNCGNPSSWSSQITRYYGTVPLGSRAVSGTTNYNIELPLNEYFVIKENNLYIETVELYDWLYYQFSNKDLEDKEVDKIVNLIQNKKSFENVKVQIFNLYGTKVFENNYKQGNHIVNLSHFKDGIYVVKYNYGNITSTKKIIKEG